MWDAPFALRAAVAVGLLATLSGIEWAVRGRRAVRWRGTCLIVIGGVCGAAFGVAVDSVTVRISPEYFALGKGLGDAPGLAARARVLGAEAGASAGVVVAGVLVWLNLRGRERRAPLPEARVLRRLVEPALGALAGAVALAVPAPDLGLGMTPGLADDEIRAFRTVQAAHAGLYLGGVAGLFGAAWSVHRARFGVRAASGDERSAKIPT